MRQVSLVAFLVLLHGAQAQVDVPHTPVVDSTALAAPLIVSDGEVIGPPSAGTTRTDTLDWRQRHSAKRAALFSAVVPGTGQIYNRKYWKAPIVWAGLGASFYFVQRNGSEFRRYKDAYLAVTDNDPTTVDEFEGQVSASQLLEVTNTYRKWRDMSYIAVGLVYILNIVDASVDANFVRFDVGRDLSLGIQPALGLTAQGAPGLSLSIALR